MSLTSVCPFFFFPPVIVVIGFYFIPLRCLTRYCHEIVAVLDYLIPSCDYFAL